ncbi:MAG: DUF1292 domain-containing protein [Oscillospiraceae bacterium]|nr:DUF1292 domain-containing protein [Oscillospiraceae bacterium]
MAMEELLDDEVDILEITDEDGNDLAFEILYSLDYQDEEYLVLAPADEAQAEEGLTILKVVPTRKGMEEFVTVDEDTAIAVYNQFRELTKDIYDFED